MPDWHNVTLKYCKTELAISFFTKTFCRKCYDQTKNKIVHFQQIKAVKKLPCLHLQIRYTVNDWEKIHDI